MAQNRKVEFLDSIHVSPPPGSVPTTSFPLTFLDMQWFFVGNVERLFFYQFPHPTSYFMENTLPTLKHSLSLALQNFFPYAANIMCPQQPGKPCIHYTDGDFVTFTIAESAADFNHVVANYPRDIKLLHPFVPQLPPSRVAEDGTRVLPVLAIQVTVFPDSGVCIGSTYNHIVGDGKSFMHFMSCWAASLNNSNSGDLTCLEHSPPSISRDVIKVSADMELRFLQSYWNWVSLFDKNSGPSHSTDTVEDKVRATFVLGRAHAERLKQLVSKDVESGQLHISTFVVACAFFWVCFIKSKESATKDSSHDHDDEVYAFAFPFDGRNRLESQVPATYFGNCLKPCLAKVKKSEIRGENGIVLAAKAIGNKIKEVESRGLRGAEHWFADHSEIDKRLCITTIAGSPKLKVYEIDFGWGRPCKVEMAHIDRDGGALALAECRDEQGGIEVGLALNKNHMDEFITVFEQNLKLISFE